MEHQRNKTHQWVDSERCMIIDPCTGKSEAFGEYCNKVGTVKEALDHVFKLANSNFPFQPTRSMIVKLQCIEAKKL